MQSSESGDLKSVSMLWKQTHGPYISVLKSKQDFKFIEQIKPQICHSMTMTGLQLLPLVESYKLMQDILIRRQPYHYVRKTGNMMSVALA